MTAFSSPLRRLYHALWGRLRDNPELRRYYFYKLFSDIASAGSARFTMSYFYFQAGISAQQVVFIIMMYGLSCLLILRPVAWIINRIGVRRAFLLHFIPDILVCLMVLHMVAQGGNPGWLLPIPWMFFQAWNVMLERVPITAYFSHFGRIETRGADLGLANIFQRAASIAAPILFGALLNEQGMIAYVIVQTVVGLLSGLALGLKKDADIRIDTHPYRMGRLVPERVTKSLFFRKLPYAFMDDLFFIWLVAMFSGDYKIVGVFYAAKLALDMLLSWLIGKYSDLERVRGVYIGAVALTALFWLIVPFATAAWQIAALQFTVGLAALAVEIPFEREYHNLARQSGHPLGWAVWREISVQSGQVVGCAISLILLSLVQDWHWLIMLGALSAMAMLWMTPQNRGKA